MLSYVFLQGNRRCHTWSKAQSRGQEEVPEATATEAVDLGGAQQLLSPGGFSVIIYGLGKKHQLHTNIYIYLIYIYIYIHSLLG